MQVSYSSGTSVGIRGTSACHLRCRKYESESMKNIWGRENPCVNRTGEKDAVSFMVGDMY